MTFGEKAVGLTFNPGGHPDVEAIKRDFATIIDRLNVLRLDAKTHEVIRRLKIAITEAQTAQMWAVKAVTWKD
jgi:hypothetical protein